MKVLIVCPSFDRIGGVANHFRGLSKKFHNEINYFFLESFRDKNLFKFIYLNFLMYGKFIKTLLKNKYDIIHLNPSLDLYSVLRDFMFLFIIKLFKAKCVLFFHGWEEKFSLIIENKYKKLFASILNLSDVIIILSKKNKDRLIKWGVVKDVIISSTKVDDDLLNNFDINKKELNKNILFLSRVEKEKGIEIVLQAFKNIIKEYKDAYLHIAGTGSAIEDAKAMAKGIGSHIIFFGHIEGEKLIDVLSNSTIYFFPTYYGEGMPTSLLEAMAFGQVIISRPVGGIADFCSEKMGYFSESTDPSEFSKIIIEYFNNPVSIRRTSIFNHTYAIENFLASKVALQLENIYKGILEKDF